MTFDKVLAFVGDRGSCKTLFAVSLAYYYSHHRIKIFTNIVLKDIDYIPVTFKEVAEFPEWLHDGVIILDEMQVGADSYNFFGKTEKGITDFITQIRKLGLSFIYITQNFTTVAKRLRLQTNYSFQFRKIADGQAQIDIFDNMNYMRPVNTILFDGREYYGLYDTKQIIEK